MNWVLRGHISDKGQRIREILGGISFSFICVGILLIYLGSFM